MYYAYSYDTNGTVSKHILTAEEKKDATVLSLSAGEIPEGTEYVDFVPENFRAKCGDEGYFVLSKGGPYVKGTYMLCEFNNKKDTEFIITDCALPVIGSLINGECYLLIVTGMRHDFDTVVTVKNGIYNVYPRFSLKCDAPYEDFKIEIHRINGADKSYSTMARLYRSYQLSHGKCIPLKERIKENESLKYASNAMNVRVRLGMKPLPAPVMEQTVENEPEMVVSCTFDRMKQLIDEFLKQGIKKAEFCLIGWNLRGHDGRYPQMFPVEPALGGEKKLRELISYGQEKGFQMTCHTNSSDAYTISDMWNDDDILVLKDGSKSVDENAWSGGRMYQLCPSVAAHQAETLIKKVADLGFKGIHYVDVISLHPPRKCYSKIHPLTKPQSVECNEKIMRICKEEIGGFSSEGAYDTSIGELDYALLVQSTVFDERLPEIGDRVIPFWEIVYHGIVLHNESWETGGLTNSDEWDERAYLKFIEYGARPQHYFYMRFSGHKEQLTAGLNTTTDESMVKSVSLLKRSYDDFDKLSFLQTEFMESHEKIADNVFKTVYSDGTAIIVDYNKLEFKVIAKGVHDA